jgi:hypothetical protein
MPIMNGTRGFSDSARFLLTFYLFNARSRKERPRIAVRPTELKEFAVTTTRVALGLLSALLIAPAATAAPLPRLSGQIYDQARAKMIRLGYRPVRFLRTEDGCLLDKSCKQYPELLGCWPTGPAHCQFAFKSPDDAKYLVVTTRGEKVRRVYSIATPSRSERKGWPMIARR